MSPTTPTSGHSIEGNRRFASILLALFLLVFVALGWSPSYRDDWLLENVLVLIFVPLLVVTHPRLPLSKLSYSSIFVFLCLHEVGSHYTYAEVPYDRWFESLVGRDWSTFSGWERNHFDRVVHFLYGVCVTYPTREIFLRVAEARGFWAYLFPLLVVMSTSLIFELLEWAAAIVFGGDLGIAYLGTQGDVWDAHKDSALATLGALLATLVVAGINARLDRDFAREWIESLRIKQPEPLGEVAIEKLLKAEEQEAQR